MDEIFALIKFVLSHPANIADPYRNAVAKSIPQLLLKWGNMKKGEIKQILKRRINTRGSVVTGSPNILGHNGIRCAKIILAFSRNEPI
jgi:hypothetical protein